MNATAERSIASILAAYYGRIAAAEPAEPEPQFRWSQLLVARAPLTQDSISRRGGDVAHAALLAAQNAARAYGDALAGMRVPSWAALDCRGMSNSPGASGGYLAGVTTAANAIDVLQQWEPIIGAGMRIDVLPSAGAIYPRMSTAATGTWFVPGSSAQPLSGSDPTVGAVSATPKSFGIVTPVSMQLRQQSNVDEIIKRHHARGLARELGRVTLNGAGGIEPVGIISTDGVGSVAGGSLDWADILAMMELVGAAGDDSSAIWIGGLDVRELLMAREGLSGSGRAIWHTDGTIAGHRAFATAHMPAATLLYGRFDAVAVAMFGMPRVEVAEHYEFEKGSSAFRVIVDCDLVVETPAAFAKATAIT
ncbi:MAG: phage major capsid protein [Burkholderiales bacterium]|nr:phage major capsid protein [Burkholderiales bacterium]